MKFKRSELDSLFLVSIDNILSSLLKTHLILSSNGFDINNIQPLTKSLILSQIDYLKHYDVSLNFIKKNLSFMSDEYRNEVKSVIEEIENIVNDLNKNL